MIPKLQMEGRKEVVLVLLGDKNTILLGLIQ